MLAKHPDRRDAHRPDLAAVKEPSRRQGYVLIESDDFVTFRCGGDSRLW